MDFENVTWPVMTADRVNDLIKAGADVNAKNRFGKSILDYAKKKRRRCLSEAERAATGINSLTKKAFSYF